MSASEVTVRRAGAVDAPPLAKLRYEFRAAEDPPVEGREAFERRCERWMSERLDGDGPWRCWVAERGGRMLGHVWLHLFEKVPNPVSEPERHGYITNLYVGPGDRGAAIGTRLLAAAVEACQEAGVDSIILWATPRSRSLYQRHGFGVPDALMERTRGMPTGAGREPEP